jgi:Tfp pilus assembly protein PilF
MDMELPPVRRRDLSKALARLVRDAIVTPGMPQDLIANLEALLEKGGDSATLRLALASRYLEAGDSAASVRHAQGAVRIDAEYSAGWKALGKALAAAGKATEAQQAFERGIEVAERRGDRQAANEMRVFVKRLARDAAQQQKTKED